MYLHFVSCQIGRGSKEMVTFKVVLSTVCQFSQTVENVFLSVVWKYPKEAKHSVLIFLAWHGRLL